MIRPIVFVVLGALATGTTLADMQLRPRALQPVTDSSMVVMDRGAKLEVFPTKRATVSPNGSLPGVVHHVTNASATAPIGPQQLGVVFNHAMQAQGYISGEIAFKVKAGQSFSGSPSLYPGLKRIIAPAVYVANARTPAEFIAVLKRLQGRTDLEWVEPTVTYESAAKTLSAQ
ncbi:MAG: hypothetical protein ACRD3Q_02145 [Terriglobales bacterium]